jgi:hypothetical protein
VACAAFCRLVFFLPRSLLAHLEGSGYYHEPDCG